MVTAKGHRVVHVLGELLGEPFYSVVPNHLYLISIERCCPEPSQTKGGIALGVRILKPDVVADLVPERLKSQPAVQFVCLVRPVPCSRPAQFGVSSGPVVLSVGDSDIAPAGWYATVREFYVFQVLQQFWPNRFETTNDSLDLSLSDPVSANLDWRSVNCDGLRTLDSARW